MIYNIHYNSKGGINMKKLRRKSGSDQGSLTAFTDCNCNVTCGCTCSCNCGSPTVLTQDAYVSAKTPSYNSKYVGGFYLSLWDA